MVLSEEDYECLASETLERLVSGFDACEIEGPEDVFQGSARAEPFEAELQGGILTIEFRDGTKYVVNSHRAARQIWMAAERSAWHFDWVSDRGSWISAKTGEELWATLERVVSQKLGRTLHLDRSG